MNIAFVFPGQGSQSVGMLADLAAVYPVIKHSFEEASDALGLDLWKLSQQGPEEELNRTEHTQPALLAAGVAVSRLWREQNGAPARLCAGHSLGEYTALVHAGALDFAEALRLVAARGRFMQEAVPAGQGAMAALLGLDDETVRRVCAEVARDQVVSAANYNAPGQVVVAGHSEAVERALEKAREAGARRAVKLAVSVPSHCELMRPAERRLSAELENTPLHAPSLPVIHNVDAEARTDATGIRRALGEQLYQPVRWVDCVRSMAEREVQVLIECGPGKVLTGLTKRIVKGLDSLAVHDCRSLDTALNTVTETAA